MQQTSDRQNSNGFGRAGKVGVSLQASYVSPSSLGGFQNKRPLDLVLHMIDNNASNGKKISIAYIRETDKIFTTNTDRFFVSFGTLAECRHQPRSTSSTVCKDIRASIQI